MMLTGAWHPIHADQEYAKTTPLGRRVAQGTLGIALALGHLETELLVSADPLIAALGIADWAYKGSNLHRRHAACRRRDRGQET